MFDHSRRDQNWVTEEFSKVWARGSTIIAAE